MSSVFLRTAWIIGSAADLLLFTVVVALGFSAYSAHVLSFMAASVLYYGYSLPYRSVLKGEAGWMIREILKVTVLAFILISLRGGVLFAFTSFESVHTVVAFLPALLLTIAGNHLYRRFILEASPDNSKRTANFLLWTAVGFSIFIRLLYLGALELIPEEAYYWLYGVNLSPGYLDHPPMVGWLIAFGVSSFGLNEFGVRFYGFALSILTAVFVSLLYVRLFGRAGVLWAFALTVSLPYVFGGGFFISPDAPLAFFWAGALFFLHKALEGTGYRNWLVFGLMIGLGMLSKYSIALLGLPALALMIVIPQYRHWFKHPAPYAAALLALVTFSPVLYWNMTNEWASFTFQSVRRFESDKNFSLHRLILDMASLVTPSMLLAVIFCSKISSSNLSQDKNKNVNLFCILSFLLPASVFIFYSLSHVPKLNWTGPSFLAVVPPVAFGLYCWVIQGTSVSEIQKTIWRSFLPVFFIWFCLIGFVLHYLGVGLPAIPYSQKMHRVIGWRSMTEEVLDISNRIQAETGTKPVLVGMDKHNIAAELAFYAEKRLGKNQVNLIGSRNIVGEEALMFRFWAPPEKFIGMPMILIAKSLRDLDDKLLEGAFESYGPIVALPLKTGWSDTKTYHYRVGYRYKGLPSVSPEVSDAQDLPHSGEVTVPMPDEPVVTAPEVTEDSPSQLLQGAEPTLSPEQAPQFTPAPPELNRS